MTERKPLTGWLVPDGQDATHEEHGDWYRAADVAALEAENARLRDASRLRPMSEAVIGQASLFRWKDAGGLVLGVFGSDWEDFPNGCVAYEDRVTEASDFDGFIPLPEAHEELTPNKND